MNFCANILFWRIFLQTAILMQLLLIFLLFFYETLGKIQLFTDYLNELNDNLPDDLLSFDTPGDSTPASVAQVPTSSMSSVGGPLPGTGAMNPTGQPTQVVVASSIGMNNTTMNGITTNCLIVLDRMFWSKSRSIINSLIISLGIIKCFEYLDRAYNYTKV